MQLITAKGRHLAVLALGALLIKSLWFSASAAIPQLAEAWQLDGNQRAWLTMSVQLGFVVGALVSAGLCTFIRAANPATWGVAMEVPWLKAYSSPLKDEDAAVIFTSSM